MRIPFCINWHCAYAIYCRSFCLSCVILPGISLNHDNIKRVPALLKWITLLIIDAYVLKSYRIIFAVYPVTTTSNAAVPMETAGHDIYSCKHHVQRRIMFEEVWRGYWPSSASHERKVHHAAPHSYFRIDAAAAVAFCCFPVVWLQELLTWTTFDYCSIIELQHAPSGLVCTPKNCN